MTTYFLIGSPTSSLMIGDSSTILVAVISLTVMDWFVYPNWMLLVKLCISELNVSLFAKVAPIMLVAARAIIESLDMRIKKNYV